MKKLLLLLIIVMASAAALPAEGFKVERAVINYKITSSSQEFMSDGTMEIAFDKFGKYMSTTTKSREMNATTIMSPEGEYMINWDDKTAFDLKSLGGMMEDESFELEKEEEGEIIGSETIIGKKCTIHLYRDENGVEKYWMWEGVPLKVESDFDGIKTTLTATSVSTPASIPADKFRVPKGIQIQKMPSFSIPGMPGAN